MSSADGADAENRVKSCTNPLIAAILAEDKGRAETLRKPMRGKDDRSEILFSYIRLDEHIPADQLNYNFDLGQPHDRARLAA
jgi:hypothetical protein